MVTVCVLPVPLLVAVAEAPDAALVAPVAEPVDATPDVAAAALAAPVLLGLALVDVPFTQPLRPTATATVTTANPNLFIPSSLTILMEGARRPTKRFHRSYAALRESVKVWLGLNLDSA
jgi:hypothetical protein